MYLYHLYERHPIHEVALVLKFYVALCNSHAVLSILTSIFPPHAALLMLQNFRHSAALQTQNLEFSKNAPTFSFAAY